jgi:ABC-type uncharacterized transport system fused permease/ATPase subunit
MKRPVVLAVAVSVGLLLYSGDGGIMAWTAVPMTIKSSTMSCHGPVVTQTTRCRATTAAAPSQRLVSFQQLRLHCRGGGGGGGEHRPDAFSSYPARQRRSRMHSWRLRATTNTNERDDDAAAASAATLNNTNAILDVDSTVPPMNWTRVLQQVGLFRQMAVPYYTESRAAQWLLGGLLLLTLANSGVAVAFSFLGKDFWNALASKSVDEFYTVLTKYVAALAIGAPIVTLYAYQRQQLAVHWREWMTARTFDLYRSHQVYYKLERDYQDAIDNPDQRLTEDVKSFTTISLSLLITVLTSIIDLASFSVILWGIDPNLFLAIIAYAGGGTLIATYLGQSLVALNVQQLRREGDLRYALVRLRDNAESIAFYGGEDLEGRGIEERLDRAMTNRRSINAAQRNLEFFTNSYRYLVQILPVSVVAYV